VSRGNKSGGASHRIPRVEREIREAVGLYLLSGFKGDLPGMVSVTRVIASRDLRTAKILVTVMGEAIDRKAVIKELQAHVHEVQHVVNRHLQMKHCPRLSFFYDEGYEHALKVERILHDLNALNDLRAERTTKVEAPIAHGDDDE
jgi:ribosome-binding factor A